MLTDAEILLDALERYTMQRKNFADLVQSDMYVNAEGNEPVQAEIDDALRMLERCKYLTERAREAATGAASARIVLPH